MQRTPQFTVELVGGEKVTGSLANAAIRCRGQELDPAAVLALDARTLFLSGPAQLHLSDRLSERRGGELSGFLELRVNGGRVKVKVDLDHVDTLIRHPD
jgi:hypothetical protein